MIEDDDDDDDFRASHSHSVSAGNPSASRPSQIPSSSSSSSIVEGSTAVSAVTSLSGGSSSMNVVEAKEGDRELEGDEGEDPSGNRARAQIAAAAAGSTIVQVT